MCLWTTIFAGFFLTGLLASSQAEFSKTSITRHYLGDIYVSHYQDLPKNSTHKECECVPGSFPVGPPKECQCQCMRDRPTFRDDTLECVNEIHECFLAEFVSSTQSEKIPYVYIPQNGQLIHPTAEIALAGAIQEDSSPLVSPICIVTKGQFLTTVGWLDILNTSNLEPPFRLFPDSDRTYLQWVGNAPEKHKCQGRILLVQLLCRDSAKPKRTLFHPCVALRVAGSPSNYYGEDISFSESSVYEVVTETRRLSVGEIVAVGMVLGGLILAYIIVSLIYWKVKKERKSVNVTQKQVEAGIPKKPGSHGPPDAKRNNFIPKTSLVSSEEDSECGDIEDLSNRTLRKLDNGAFMQRDTRHNSSDAEEEDIYSTPSEEEENEGRRLRLERLRMEMEETNRNDDEEDGYEVAPSPLGLSIIETTRSESGVSPNGFSYSDEDVYNRIKESDHLDLPSKRKLYFNPSYFEKENLKAPPPAAMEFLSKIRDMISVAKSKMQNKTFQPSLIDIPEDDYSLKTSAAPSTISYSRNSNEIKISVEEEDNDNDSDLIYKDTLSRNSKNSSTEGDRKEESRANTLKRLAQRVNTHGQTFVSELIRSLDLKPRLPETYYNPYPTTSNVPVSAPLPANNKEQKVQGETAFPELVKPSMLRNAKNKDLCQGTDPVTFENFRQEMLATLSKVKTISPVSSLNRNQLDQKSSPEGDIKVHNWLQTLEGKKLSPIKNDANTKSMKKVPPRSMSFNHAKEQISLASHNGNIHKVHLFSKGVSRSSSFVDGEQLYPESISKRQRIPDKTSLFREDSLNSNTSKTQTEVSSNQNDNFSSYKDSLECAIEDHTDNSVNMNDSMRSNALLSESNMNTQGTGVYGNPFHSDHENSYEEIQFGSIRQRVPGALMVKGAKIESYLHALQPDSIEEELQCSIYSNPDSLVSEILITGEKPIGMQSLDNRLSIEVTDDTLSSDCDGTQQNTHSGSKKKKKKVKRNDSIIQDSLERPKVKKKLSNADKKEHETNYGIGKFNILSKAKLFENHGEDLLLSEDISKVKRSKTLRTFKDYQIMNFSRKNPNGNQLSLLGEGINFNFKGPNASTAVHKPPLPPKHNIHLDSNHGVSELSSDIYTTQSIEKLVPTVPPKHKLRHSTSLASDLYRNSNSLSLSSETAPALPPKLKPKNSFSGRFSHSPEQIPPMNLLEVANSEPPRLPEKIKNKNDNGSLHTLNQKLIPELSEEEAKFILHGTLSENHVATKLTENFLDYGNIDDKTSSSLVNNVPLQNNEHLSNIHMYDDERLKLHSLPSLRRSQSLLHTTESVSSPPFCRDRIRGQFILSNNGPVTLQRQRSFARESNVISQLRQITADLGEAAMDEEIDGPLAQAIKGELEKHFKEKSDADSVKRTWRKVLEKVDSDIDQNKLTLKDLQKYIAALESESSDVKVKQEDSGYHSSTDSSDSSRLKNSSFSNSFKTNIWKTNLKRNGTIAASSDIMKRTAGFFQRSAAMQFMPGSLDIQLIKKDSFNIKKHTGTTKGSVGNGKNISPKLSLYVNDTFSGHD